MAKFKISSWVNGINTRINKFRIRETEAIDVVDADLSNIELKPQKGLDNSSGAQPPGDYNFKNSWETDEDATKFTESGDLLIKSYSGGTAPKFNRRKYSKSGEDIGVVGEKTLGVPVQPSSEPSVSKTTSVSGGDLLAFSSVLNESFGATRTDCTTDNGLQADVSTNETSGFTVKKAYGSVLALFNPTTKLLRRRNVTTGALTYGTDVTLTNASTYFFHNGFLVGLDDEYENATVIDIVNSATATNISLPKPSDGSTFFSNNGFGQTHSSGTNAFNGNCVGMVSGWNSTGWTQGARDGGTALKGDTRRSVTVNEGNVFVSRDYVSRFQAESSKQFYEGTGGSTRTGSGMAYTSYAAPHNLYNATKQGVAPRYEVEARRYHPTLTSNICRVDHTQNDTVYSYDTTNGYTTGISTEAQATSHNKHLHLWVVPYSHINITTDSTNNSTTTEVNYAAIKEFIQQFSFEDGLYSPNSPYSGRVGAGPFKWGDKAQVQMQDGGSELKDYYFQVLFRAIPITISSVQYYAILIGGACFVNTENIPLGHTASSNEIWSPFYYAGNPHFKWSSFQKHYIANSNTGTTTTENTQEFGDGKWYYNNDGTNQAYHFRVDHEYTASPTTIIMPTHNQYGNGVFARDLRVHWFNSDIYTADVGTEYGPKLYMGTGANDYLTVEVYDKDTSAYVKRFGFRTATPSGSGTPTEIGAITHWSAKNGEPAALTEKTFSKGSSSLETNNDRYNLLTVLTRIPLSSLGSTSHEIITGLKTVTPITGPKASWELIKSVRRHELPNHTASLDNVQPLRDNLLFHREESSWEQEGTYITDVNLSSHLSRIILTEQTDTDLSDSSVSFSVNNKYLDDSSVRDSTKSYQISGASTGDIVLYNYSGNSYRRYQNVRAAGTTLFGTEQSTYTIGKHDIVKQNGTDIAFINSTGSGDTVQILDTTNNTIAAGSTKYPGVKNVKDIWFYSPYVIYRTSNNSCFVFTTSGGNNQIAVFSVPFNDFHYYSGNYFYGTTDSSGSVDDYKKAFVFFDYQIDALEGGVALYESAADGTRGTLVRTINKILRKPNTRDFYVLFQDDNSFTYSRQNFYLYLDSDREIKFAATADIENATATMLSTTSINPDTAHDEMKLQVHDNITLSGSATGTAVINSKAVNNFGISAAASSSNATGVNIKAVRYVSKNKPFLLSSNYSNVSTNTDTAYSLDYSSVGAEVTCSTETTRGFIPYLKSEDSLVTDSSDKSYFFIKVDKNTIKASNSHDIGSDSYTLGGANLYLTGGLNLEMQYKYSFLRKISVSGEDDMFLEGPASNPTPEITVTQAADTVTLSSFDSPPSDVSKVRIYRSGGNYTRFYRIADIDVTGGVIPDYIDNEYKVKPGFFQPLPNVGEVPSGLTNIVVVNGIYIGSEGSKIRFSEYGNPHSWPELGFAELHGEVSNIIENNGEAVVFTENSTYRVRGYSFDSMSVSRIPINQGIPAKNKHSLTEYRNNLYFISSDGLCTYSNGAISLISSGKFSSFPDIATPRAVWKDDVLYIFEGNDGSNENGVKLDLRAGETCYTRISQKALNRAFYDPITDKLYISGGTSATSGKYLDGSNLSLTYQSGEFTGGDAEKENIFFRFSVLYSGSGRMEWYSNNIMQHAVEIPSSVNPDVFRDEFSEFISGTSVSYKVTGDITIFGVELESDEPENYTYPKRYKFADVLYTGQPTVQFFFDNIQPAVITAPTFDGLSSTVTPKTVRLNFPSNTIGNIPHYVTGGTGDVLSVNYDAEEL